MENIVNRARELFFRYGIKSITMDDIARELGMSKKTIYQFVKDKTDLVEKVFRVEFEQNDKDLSKAFHNRDNAIDELIELHCVVREIMARYNPATYYDLKKYYPDIFKKFMQQKLEKISAYLLRNLNRGKSEGFYRSDLNEEIIARHTFLRLFQLIYGDILDIQELLSPDYFAEILIYHIRGISSDKGLELLKNNLYKIYQINN